MKTNTQFIAICLLAVSIGWHLHASLTYDAPNGHGVQIGLIPTGTNTYQSTQFAGDCEDEMNYYIVRAQRHKPIPEILPAAQDTSGNWGMPTDGMQLSVRFRKHEFLRGETVPALIILRNLGTTTRSWWRNSLPDLSYQFTVYRGTNVFTWARPQKGKPSRLTMQSGGNGNMTDPYHSSISPHMEEFTGVDINHFFDLSQLGKYSLQVQIQVPTSDGKDKTNIISGVASFQVVEKLSSSAMATTNDNSN
jgi:hypothetical protein